MIARAEAGKHDSTTSLEISMYLHKDINQNTAFGACKKVFHTRQITKLINTKKEEVTEH